MLRKINKDSDNYEAERLLEAVGAEVLGGPATTDKGVAVLRDVLSEFGLDPRSYLPKNGSGLGHSNRISARAMTDLLRALYLDPRVGPELLQSLSVGGVDGTTRNRFRGLPVARHVRAKTGTLNGNRSCRGWSATATTSWRFRSWCRASSRGARSARCAARRSRSST